LSSGVEVIEEITCRTVSRSASVALLVYLRSLRPKNHDRVVVIPFGLDMPGD